ncbi:MAG TPA: preprotein translocase subunit SecG [Gemmatimonadaceae bacterium]|jgi:preprotein translocase subunit SecG
MISKILITLLAIDSVLLIAAILLQAGKGGGLAASFGGVTSSADAILGTRQAGNLLTKLTWWCGGLFLGLAFLLSIASSKRGAPRSILDQTFTTPPVQTAPATTQPNTNVLPIQPAPASGNAKTPASTKTKTKSSKSP